MMDQTINVTLPVNIEENSMHLFKPYSSYKITHLKVKTIKNVFITHTGLAINKNGLIKETHHDNQKQYNDYLNEASFYYQDAISNPTNRIDLDDENVYLLIHHPWFNYYHWICESILRLWLVKSKVKDTILLLPEYYQNSDFIMGSLEPFNIEKIYYIPNGKSLYVHKLCIPQIKPHCDSYHEKLLKQIREFYIHYVVNEKKINIDFGENIYISRKKAARKKVTNEDEVEKILLKYNFKILYNEDFTFLEQVSIFSNAKFLVSIHGSGLTNMLFMKSNSSILELHKEKTNELDHPSFVFWYQSAALGYKYYHQVCKPLGINDDYFHGNFQVDTVLLDRNLYLMCRK